MNMKVHLQDEVLVTKSNDGTIAGDEIVICGATVGVATELHVRTSNHLLLSISGFPYNCSFKILSYPDFYPFHAAKLHVFLQVSVEQHSGKEVLSDFARILVYAPLSIHPSSLVLAPGAKYVVTALTSLFHIVE